MEIFIPVLLMAVVGALCAVLLTVASVRFAVKRDERAEKIRACLPGANCGACGFSGCDGYAKALADGTTDKTNLCVPGADGVAKQIADVLGVEAQDVIEQVAYVGCNGCVNEQAHKYLYEGPRTCLAANMMYAGDRFCSFACLGYGDCAAVCTQGAISIGERGVATVDPRKCVGCGLCAKACPNHIIHLVADVSRVLVKCSNHDKGAQVRTFCSDGCIGCGLCERKCPEGAIHVEQNLAVVDYTKCTGCATCVGVCPVKCIHEENLLCGAKFAFNGTQKNA